MVKHQEVMKSGINKVKACLGVMGLCAFILASGLSHAAEKLVIAVQPTASQEELAAQSKEIQKVLEDKLGVQVELLFPTSYASVVEALNFGHAHAAFMGAWPALLASQRGGAEILLAEIREVMIGSEKKEMPSYYSYWIVKKDAAASALSEFKGKRAAFPSQLSSSGYVAPLSRLVDMKLISSSAEEPADPKQFFADVLYAGGYAQAWQALKSGQVDVAVIAGDVPEKLYREVMDNVKVIEQQGPIPSHVIVAGRHVDADLKAKIRDAFLEFNKPEYRPLMRKFVSGIFVRFVPAGAEHVEPLKAMVEKTNLQFKE